MGPLLAALRKAGGHKYIRREPTGDARRPWRYVYRDAQGREYYGSAPSTATRGAQHGLPFADGPLRALREGQRARSTAAKVDPRQDGLDFTKPRGPTPEEIEALAREAAAKAKEAKGREVLGRFRSTLFKADNNARQFWADQGIRRSYEATVYASTGVDEIADGAAILGGMDCSDAIFAAVWEQINEARASHAIHSPDVAKAVAAFADSLGDRMVEAVKTSGIKAAEASDLSEDIARLRRSGQQSISDTLSAVSGMTRELYDAGFDRYSPEAETLSSLTNDMIACTGLLNDVHFRLQNKIARAAQTMRLNSWIFTPSHWLPADSAHRYYPRRMTKLPH